MVQKSLLSYFYIFIFSIALLTSCQKGIDANWDTDLLVPLISSTLDAGDIFGDTNVVRNPNQTLSLVVEQELDFLNTDLTVEIDDTLSVDIFNLPFTLTVKPGQKVIERSNVSKINFGEMELTKARASVAKMKFYVTNTIKQPLLVNYKLYSATNNGVVYEVTEDVPAADANGNAYVVKTIDLDNYDIDLKGPNQNAINTIYSLTTVWLHPDADTAIVGPTDSVIIVSTFDQFEPEFAQGYLGNQMFHESSSTALKIFSDFASGSFDLEKANAQIDLYNYIGADLSIEIEELSTLKRSPYALEKLEDVVIGKSINCLRANLSQMPQFPVYPTHYSYNIVGSNLDKMIEIMPDSLRFRINGQLNPLGNVSFGNDFIYFKNGLKTNVKLDIPLKFSAQDLVIQSFASFNFDNESLNGGNLTIYLDNLFPFDLDVQFYFVDNQQAITDSLLNNASAVFHGVPMSGIVTSPTSSKLVVELTPQLIQRLLTSDGFLIKAKVNSAQNQHYQLYSHYGLSIRIVGDFSYAL